MLTLTRNTREEKNIQYSNSKTSIQKKKERVNQYFASRKSVS